MSEPGRWPSALMPLSDAVPERVGRCWTCSNAQHRLVTGEDGDFVGIHTDPYGCELAVLTLLSGPVEALHCHLHLADTPLSKIRDLAEATNGLPEGGTSFDISDVPFLFSGQRIPHHRAPRDRESEIVM